MSKRPRYDGNENESHINPKRLRPSDRDRFSNLSDELVLRILSYLPLSDRIVSLRCVGHCYH